MMLLLMSFTTKTEIEYNKEVMSPECFEFASAEADSSIAYYGSLGSEYDHEIFEYWYDYCEDTNDYDEFQF